MDTRFAISQYPDTDRINQELNQLIKSPIYSIKPEVLAQYESEYYGKKCQKSKVMMSAIERQGNTMLGIYNESGVIVGYGFTSVGGDMHEFYAYDAQCPNCYKEYNMPRYMLSLNSDGTAYCSKCKRTYSLKNGGVTDNGNKLLRYRATSTGPNGILAINN